MHRTFVKNIINLSILFETLVNLCKIQGEHLDSLLVFQQTARKKSVLDLLFLIANSYDPFSATFPLITNDSKNVKPLYPFCK